MDHEMWDRTGQWPGPVFERDRASCKLKQFTKYCHHAHTAKLGVSRGSRFDRLHLSVVTLLIG